MTIACHLPHQENFVCDADHNRIKETSNGGQIYFINPGNTPLFEKHANYKG